MHTRSRHGALIGVLLVAGCFSELAGAAETEESGSETSGGSVGTGGTTAVTPTSVGPGDTTTFGEESTSATEESTSPGGTDSATTTSSTGARAGRSSSSGEPEPICGDGILQGEEDCDDGNDVPQDGCEADCERSTGVAKIASGDQHACALFHDGRLRCWGSNNYGKLGYGHLEHIGDDETPASAGDVDVGASVVDVACGREHVCVVLEGGAVRCWGFNNRGQLGIPAPTYALLDVIGDEPSELPSALPDVNLGGVAVAVTATSWTTFVLMDDGTVRCFGQNANFGTCGYGTDEFAIGDDEHPVVEGPIELGGLAVQVDGHGDHACAVLENGSVRCWGFNEQGALGIGNLEVIGDDEHPSSQPALTFGAAAVRVQTGLRHTCVQLENGEVKCWGRNVQAELGLGHLDPVPSAADGGPLSLGGGAVQIAVGGGHGCVLLDNGDVRCWGDANFGRLGYGDQTNDVGDDEVPSEMPPLELAVGVVHDLEVGNSYSCARVDEGDVMCWGANSSGQIGQPGVSYFGDNETLGGLSPIVLED